MSFAGALTLPLRYRPINLTEAICQCSTDILQKISNINNPQWSRILVRLHVSSQKLYPKMISTGTILWNFQIVLCKRLDSCLKPWNESNWNIKASYKKVIKHPAKILFFFTLNSIIQYWSFIKRQTGGTSSDNEW